MSCVRRSIYSVRGILTSHAAESAHSGKALVGQPSGAPSAGGSMARTTGPLHVQQQQRGIVSVDVHGNKVDRALRMLRRKLIDEGVRETWLKQRVFVKPSHERKRVLEEAERRDRNKGFKEKMRWILRRKARGY
jgi:ribosomal protein S21